MKNKKSKRHSALIPLSHDHREMLAFCLHIQKGIQKNTPIDTLKNYIHWFWDNVLEAHFREEEKVLFPLFKDNGELVLRLRCDHDTLAELFQLKDYSMGDIAQIESLLREHIRFEERYAFEYLQQHTLFEDLNILTLSRNEVKSCDWIKPFWN